jgi:hypothetical protein
VSVSRDNLSPEKKGKPGENQPKLRPKPTGLVLKKEKVIPALGEPRLIEEGK